MKSREKFDTDALQRLRKDIELHLCRSFSTPADFIFLSDRLLEDNCGYVSPTTLKRVWGYISDKGEQYVPSNFTRRALCKLIGYKDWNDYKENYSSIQSREYAGEFLETIHMPLNTELTLFWQPNRRIRLRHIKPSLFSVLENENSSLKIGDVAECHCFTQYAPAFFRIFRQESLPISYVAGSATGIFYIVHSDSDVTSDPKSDEEPKTPLPSND